MNKMGYCNDYVSSGISKGNSNGFMGQPPLQTALSIAPSTPSNPLSPHKYMIPYIYNMIVYMSYMMYVLLLLNIRTWGDGAKDRLGYGGDRRRGWGAYTKCAQ